MPGILQYQNKPAGILIAPVDWALIKPGLHSPIGCRSDSLRRFGGAFEQLPVVLMCGGFFAFGGVSHFQIGDGQPFGGCWFWYGAGAIYPSDKIRGIAGLLRKYMICLYTWRGCIVKLYSKKYCNVCLYVLPCGHKGVMKNESESEHAN